MVFGSGKRQIFLTNNPGLESEFSEISLPSVQERIQRWLQANGYLPADDPQEYGTYIERCFPIAEDRRRYFQALIQKAKPHIGYKILCLLAKADVVQGVWTTNFDGLSAKAATAYELTPIEVGLDCRERVIRQPQRGELLCVALHGDYRYDELKNTDSELQMQDATLRSALGTDLERRSLIVCGYSGRDASVMEALVAAYSRPGTGTLYWCGYGDSDPAPPVAALLTAARAAKRLAHYVPAQGFDDLLIRLGLHCLSGEARKQAQVIAAQAISDPLDHQTPFSIPPAPLAGVIKSNCFPIECPSDVLTFEVTDLPQTGVWKHIRGVTAGHDVVAAPYKRKVVALGTTDAVYDLFRGRIKGAIDRTAIDQQDLCYEDSSIVFLLLTSLVRCFEKKFALETDGRRLVWDARTSVAKTINGTDCFQCQAALLAL